MILYNASRSYISGPYRRAPVYPINTVGPNSSYLFPGEAEDERVHLVRVHVDPDLDLVVRRLHHVGHDGHQVLPLDQLDIDL